MAAQSTAQPATSEGQEVLKEDSEQQTRVSQHSPQQNRPTAKHSEGDHEQKADHTSAAHSELDDSDTPPGMASVLPAANRKPADHSVVSANGPESVLQAVGPPPQKHACQSKSRENIPAPRREAAAFAADTPDELEIDCDEEIPQRLQQPQRAQCAQLEMFHGQLSATGGGRGQPAKSGISSGKEVGSALSAAQDPPTGGEASSLAAAPTPSTGLPAAQDSKLHVSASGGQHSADADHLHASDSSDPSGPRAKKPRTAGPGMERSSPPKEGKTPIASEAKGIVPCKMVTVRLLHASFCIIHQPGCQNAYDLCLTSRICQLGSSVLSQQVQRAWPTQAAVRVTCLPASHHYRTGLTMRTDS